MRKRFKTLLQICLSASLIGCAGAPQMPDIEISFVDVANKKLHVYMLPKKPGESAKRLRSEPLTLLGLDQHFTISIENYTALEGYASAVEAYFRGRCQ